MKKTKYGRCAISGYPRNSAKRCEYSSPLNGRTVCCVMPNSRIKPKHGRGSK